MAPLTSDQLVRAYSMGVFPMARHRHDDQLFWVDPEERGILPLDEFHLPHSMRKVLRQTDLIVRCDSAFEEVIRLCAEPAPNRPATWINDDILRLFVELHGHGLGHSVEVWRDKALVGGLYGLSLGGAFFGESMFSREKNASKIALAHLVARLKKSGYLLLDTQFVTEHLSQFGAVEIPRRDYRKMLAKAIGKRARFFYGDLAGADVLALLSSQSKTQIS